jgi:hypothetical protein
MVELSHSARQKYQRGSIHGDAGANRDDIFKTTEVPKFSSPLMVVLRHHGPHLTALHAL